MPCNASYTRFIFGKVFHMYCKLICILYALLCWKKFILVKIGCYTHQDLYPSIAKPIQIPVIQGGSQATYNRKHPVPMRTDFITFRRLENLHVTMPRIAQSHFRGVRPGDHIMPLQRLTIGASYASYSTPN
jgi:hypothetical protein